MSTTLRLEWPQWQGSEAAAIDRLTERLSPYESRTVYGLGGQLAALLAPPVSGPVARVDVPDYVEDLEPTDGIIGKAEIIRQHEQALRLMRQADADRVVTIGGTCAVSVSPFSYLADRYPDDVAILWLDSHADSNVPGGPNAGFNTMVVSHLTGHGDKEIVDSLPATVPSSRVVLAGVHGWDDLDRTGVEEWGFGLVPPADDTAFRQEVLDKLHDTGARHVMIHLDLDVINSDEHAFGMAWEPDGISKATALNTIADVSAEFDLVGLTIAEFVPREAVVLRTILGQLPLLGGELP